MSKLMRHIAFPQDRKTENTSLGALADWARQAANNAGASIDEAVAFIQASNDRIAQMESNATGRVVARAAELRRLDRRQ